MTAARALMIRATDPGWAVCLTDGQELIRYRGPFAKRLALRYLQRYAQGIQRPAGRGGHTLGHS